MAAKRLAKPIATTATMQRIVGKRNLDSCDRIARRDQQASPRHHKTGKTRLNDFTGPLIRSQLESISIPAKHILVAIQMHKTNRSLRKTDLVESTVNVSSMFSNLLLQTGACILSGRTTAIIESPWLFRDVKSDELGDFVSLLGSAVFKARCRSYIVVSIFLVCQFERWSAGNPLD